MAKDNNKCGVGVAYDSNIGCKYLMHTLFLYRYVYLPQPSPISFKHGMHCCFYRDGRVLYYFTSIYIRVKFIVSQPCNHLFLLMQKRSKASIFSISNSYVLSRAHVLA